MKYRIITVLSFSIITLVTMTCFIPGRSAATHTSDPLYDSIAAMDGQWEDAYNNCKMSRMEDIISEDLEFYHDQGGLTTSKKAIMEALQKNICGKVTRELKKGSMEVYAIRGFGAVEMGLHAFHNNREPNAKPHFSKFVHLWKRENGKWRITRVISLH